MRNFATFRKEATRDYVRALEAHGGLAAQRLLGWSPQELMENADLEMRRDTEEGWRIAYVAATRARDLLVVAATGDEIRHESWLMPLSPALYPAKGKSSKPAAQKMYPL